MSRVALVAGNVFRGILSKRALYVWAAAIVLMLLRSGPAIFFSEQNQAFAAFLRANAISGALDSWAMLALAAAIFLGAASVGGEMTNKTISTVLARPIRRWEFLVGHWLGVTLFSLSSLAIGLVLGVGLSWYYGIEIDRGRAAIALAQTVGGIMLFAAIGVGLGSNTSVAFAAAFSVLLVFLPPIVTILSNDTRPWQHYPGVVLDYLTPPGYTSHYQGIAWADPPPPATPRAGIPVRMRQRPVVDYPVARKRLFTNVGYAAAYFLAGCLFFTRRDVAI
jgi:ABC-type Na+ efflux pump permease subunit